MLCAKCAPRNSGLLIRWAAVQRTAPPVWTFCSMCLSPLCVYNIPNWDEGYNRDFDNVAMETQILGKVFCQPSTKQVQIQSGCFWAIIQCAFHCSIWNVQEFFRFFNLPFTIAFKTAADWRWPKKAGSHFWNPGDTILFSLLGMEHFWNFSRDRSVASHLYVRQLQNGTGTGRHFPSSCCKYSGYWIVSTKEKNQRDRFIFNLIKKEPRRQILDPFGTLSRFGPPTFHLGERSTVFVDFFQMRISAGCFRSPLTGKVQGAETQFRWNYHIETLLFLQAVKNYLLPDIVFITFDSWSWISVSKKSA